MPLGLLGIVYAAFFLTGGTALVLELLWSRQFVTIFGNSPFAISVVLCAFMAGQGLGGLLGGRLADRTDRRLLWFAGIEAGVALCALAIPAGLGGLLRAEQWAAGVAGYSPLASNALRFVLSFAVLLAPSLLMGATLPLLSRFCTDARGALGRRVGMLYGLNTLGSAAGCFGAGYWMVQTLGLSATNHLAAGANLAVAAALALAHAARAGRGPLRRPARMEARTAPPPIDAADADRPPRALVPAMAFVFGLVGLACEGVWARHLVFFTNYTYTFTNLLGIYLLGLGAGSLLYRVALSRVRRRIRLLAAVELMLGLAVFLCFALGALFYAHAVYTRLPSPFTMALLTVMLPALLMGIAFPLLCAAYAPALDNVGRSVGRLYALNTAGSILGALLPTFVSVPLLGVQGSIVVFALFYCGVAVLLLALGGPAGRLSAGLRTAGSAAALLAVLALAMPHDLCQRVFLATSPQLRRQQGVVFWREGRTATAIVVRDKVNGLQQVYINQALEVPTQYPDMLCFKLMGCLGPLLQPHPDRVLVVAFGGGVAVGTVARFPEVKSVQVVELEPSVVEAASLLKAQNNGSYADPKVHITIEDGRNYLLNCPTRWPVIVCDSTHPKSADSWVLYTQEFYRAVRQRLSADGVFVQWVPAHGLKAAEYRVIVRTFQSVFPHTSLWVTRGISEAGVERSYTLLVATPGPLSVSADEMERKLAQPSVAADLRPWGLGSPAGVLETFVCAGEPLRHWVGPGPINTDDLPITQYDTALARSGPDLILPSFLSCLQSADAYLAPSASPSQEEPLRAELARRLAATRLFFEGKFVAAHELLPDDPKMVTCWHNFHAGAAYWAAVGRLYPDVPGALAWMASKAEPLPGGLEVAATLYRQAIAVYPAYAYAHRQLALILANGPDPASALPELTQALKVWPRDADLHDAMGNALASVGEAARAEAFFREAIRLAPTRPRPCLDLARLLATQGRLSDAAALCRRALALAPNHPSTHYAMANVLMMQGQPEAAAEEFSAVLRIAPNDENARRGLAAARSSALQAGPNTPH